MSNKELIEKMKELFMQKYREKKLLEKQLKILDDYIKELEEK
jgi:hypothetical protein